MAAVLAWRAVAIMIAIADRLVRNGGIAKRRVLGGDRRVGWHGRGAVRSGIGGHRLIDGHGGGGVQTEVAEDSGAAVASFTPSAAGGRCCGGAGIRVGDIERTDRGMVDNY